MFNLPSKTNQKIYLKAKKIYYKKNEFNEDPLYNKFEKEGNFDGKSIFDLHNIIENSSIENNNLDIEKRENFMESNYQKKNSFDLITTNFNQFNNLKKEISLVLNKKKKIENFQYKTEDKTQDNYDFHTNNNIDHNTNYTNNNTNSNLYCVTNNNLKIKNDISANHNSNLKNQILEKFKNRNFSNISNLIKVSETANNSSKTSRNYICKNTNNYSFKTLENKKHHCRSKSLNFTKHIEIMEIKNKSKLEKSFESKINSLNEINCKIKQDENIYGKSDFNF